ncbi:MAG: TolC family protein [Candidatus Melainabacteria bacterium]|nr:TolC family protein [Candidatus Melainabacteria bacterium]
MPRSVALAIGAAVLASSATPAADSNVPARRSLPPAETLVAQATPANNHVIDRSHETVSEMNSRVADLNNPLARANSRITNSSNRFNQSKQQLAQTSPGSSAPGNADLPLRSNPTNDPISQPGVPSSPMNTTPANPNPTNPTNPINLNSNSGGPTDAGRMTLPADLTGPIEQPASDSTGVPRELGVAQEEALNNSQRRRDYELIDTQATEFRQRFLQAEAIEIRLPMPDQMIPLGPKLPPIRLEARYTRPISLNDCVDYALDHNLEIRIQKTDVDSRKWLLFGSVGRYLPDIFTNYRHEYLKGGRLVGGIIPVTFNTPNVTTAAGFNFFGFRGGEVTFGALSALHTYKAQKQRLFGAINDTLLDVTRGYYTMLRNEALLEIQTRAVDVSQAQVNLNQQLETAGTGTRFQVLQSETQLARDQQNLLTQEVSLRRAAIDLGTILNLDTDVNLLSVESQVKKVRLISAEADINRLITLAIENRPELKQFEQLRIAAKRNVQVAAAPLYPQLNFFGNITGSGATLGRSIVYSQPSFRQVPLAGAPVTTPIIRTGNGGFTVDNSSLGFGQTPGSSLVLPTGSEFIPPAAVNRQVRSSYNIGIQVDWNFEAMGTRSLANIQSNRALARGAQLRSNQELMRVLQEVRDSYLTSQTAERQIEVATKAVISAAEQLRLSRVRLANGVGTNIDVINAQRDFTTSLVNKADSIVAFNIAQAELLRNIGLIGRQTLIAGRPVR